MTAGGPRVGVSNVAAVTPLGDDWSATWRALLGGERAPLLPPPDGLAASVAATTCAIANLDRQLDIVADRVLGAAGRLATDVLKMIEQPQTGSSALYGGFAHAESEVITALADADGANRPAAWWASLLEESLVVQVHSTTREFDEFHWVGSACASSLHALGFATQDLSAGDVDTAVVLGVDPLSPLGVIGFAQTNGATLTDCRPFQHDHNGVLVSEAAAAIRLSRHEEDVAVLGVGASCDAGHPTQPDPHGDGMERAFRSALAAADLHPEDIVAIIAHGSGTKLNDESEVKALRRIYPTKTPPTTSIKGALGHVMGAAGLLNLAVATETVRSGHAPPTSPDSQAQAMELDLVLGGVRSVPSGRPVAACCAGFGGNNVVAIVGSGR